MKIITTELKDVILLEPLIHVDTRGYFIENFRGNDYADIGLPTFVQDNMSYSSHGVLRGLHYQVNPAQAKLISVLSGSIYDVAVDIRPQSATFGQWVGVHLSEDNHRQLFIPAGFAHGFVALAQATRVYYKCSQYYHAEGDRGIRFDDPDLAINWQVSDPILSKKDRAHPFLKDCEHSELPL